MTKEERYMNRCLQLAELGAGQVSPNPMVGAILVYKDVIIGEGYHQQYGGSHAEVNCIKNVTAKNRSFISSSTLYVSLEPCAHYGKTPPCALLIIEQQIPEVIIACRDSFEKVNGQGSQILKEAGIKVKEGVLEKEARELNKRFFTYQEKKRPFIKLKWAQTNDHFIAKSSFEKLKVSNEYTNRFTHKLRAEEDAIIVGTNTVKYDNPSLTTRNWSGKNPLRIIIDKQLLIPEDSAVLDTSASTVILNFKKEEIKGHLHFYKVQEEGNLIPELLDLLYKKNIHSIIVEGGTVLLQSFIDANLWDEAIVISNTSLNAGTGIAAPILSANHLFNHFKLLSDEIAIYKNL